MEVVFGDTIDEDSNCLIIDTDLIVSLALIVRIELFLMIFASEQTEVLEYLEGSQLEHLDIEQTVSWVFDDN